MKGIESYHKYYSDLFGPRWETLRRELEGPAHFVARLNSFFLQQNPDILTNTEQLKNWGVGLPSPRLPLCFEVLENFQSHQFTTDVWPFYKMDPASILAAQALNVQEGDVVLDMCAAPGGKTLVLAQALSQSGELVANELSPKRRLRLMNVLDSYLPKQVRARVDVRGFDGALYGLKKANTFDRILLDAPCSGDRGLLQKPGELESWSPKKVKGMAIRQYSLLASAFMALKPGGTLVYSTCAISPLENDGVIDKLFKKKPGEFEILKSPCPLGEETAHGRLILPDRDQAGPIFFAVVKKTL